MNTNSTASGLFQNAAADGSLSDGALAAIQVHDLGADFQAALGVSVDDITASEVTLVSLLLDDSGSIRHAGNEPVVRDGYNLVLDALRQSKQRDGILVMCRYLNGTLLTPYAATDQAPLMDTGNFKATGGTPLYDESVVTLAAVLAKYQELVDNGIACRTVTLIVSDGADAHSRRSTAADVQKLARDMQLAESHIVAFMGIDDGVTDFKQVARDMGIQDEWVLVPGNTPGEIRKAFAMFSQSTQRASQSATSFSQTAMGGGFAAP